MARKTIQAAGGIVVRSGGRPRIAVVQRSKDDRWVLPRGKLERHENPVAGARREVVEETGHRVKVHEYLGAITYRARGRPKVVQFWRMKAAAQPSHDIMEDIVAVEWLPLAAAVRRLSYPLEKLFLHNVGRRMLRRHHKRTLRRKRRAHAAKGKSRRRSKRKPHAGKPVANQSRPPLSKTRAHARKSRFPAHGPASRTTQHAAPGTARRTMLQRMLGRLGG